MRTETPFWVNASAVVRPVGPAPTYDMVNDLGTLWEPRDVCTHHKDIGGKIRHDVSSGKRRRVLLLLL